MPEKKCFVIAPIGDEDSETRKRSDQVLKHVITPPLQECGYSAMRADHISEPGMITSQVIQHIVEDDLVVADLTERNPNVFYELAIRHAIREPLVQLIRRGDQMPFDVANTRTIQVDHRDLDSVDAAKKAITKQVRALETDPSPLETPISSSLALNVLQKSTNPEERSLGDVLSSISELRSSVVSLEKRLESPEGLLSPETLRFLVRNVTMRSRGMHIVIQELRHLVEDVRASIDESADPSARERLEERTMRMRVLLSRLTRDD